MSFQRAFATPIRRLIPDKPPNMRRIAQSIRKEKRDGDFRDRSLTLIGFYQEALSTSDSLITMIRNFFSIVLCIATVPVDVIPVHDELLVLLQSHFEVERIIEKWHHARAQMPCDYSKPHSSILEHINTEESLSKFSKLHCDLFYYEKREFTLKEFRKLEIQYHSRHPSPSHSSSLFRRSVTFGPLDVGVFSDSDENSADISESEDEVQSDDDSVASFATARSHPISTSATPT